MSVRQNLIFDDEKGDQITCPFWKLKSNLVSPNDTMINSIINNISIIKNFPYCNTDNIYTSLFRTTCISLMASLIELLFTLSEQKEFNTLCNIPVINRYQLNNNPFSRSNNNGQNSLFKENIPIIQNYIRDKAKLDINDIFAIQHIINKNNNIKVDFCSYLNIQQFIENILLVVLCNGSPDFDSTNLIKVFQKDTNISQF